VTLQTLGSVRALAELNATATITARCAVTDNDTDASTTGPTTSISDAPAPSDATPAPTGNDTDLQPHNPTPMPVAPAENGTQSSDTNMTGHTPAPPIRYNATANRTQPPSRNVSFADVANLPTEVRVVAEVAVVSVATVFAPTAAARVPSVGAAFRAVDCRSPDDDAPDVLEHPAQPGIGDGAMARFTGAAVCSAAFVVFGVAVAEAVSRRPRPGGVSRTAGKLAGAGAAVLASYFVPGVAGTAVFALSRDSSTLQKVLCGAALGAVAAVTLLLAWRILELPVTEGEDGVKVVATRQAQQDFSGDVGDAQDDSGRGAQYDNGRAAQYDNGDDNGGADASQLQPTGGGNGDDGSAVAKNDGAGMLSIVFKPFADGARAPAGSVRRRLFFVEELLFAASVSGVASFSNDACHIAPGVVVVALAAVHLAYHLPPLRAYDDKLDVVFSVANGLVILVFGVLSILVSSGTRDAEELETAARVVLIFQTACFVLQPVIGAVRAARNYCHKKKERRAQPRQALRRGDRDNDDDGNAAALSIPMVMRNSASGAAQAPPPPSANPLRDFSQPETEEARGSKEGQGPESAARINRAETRRDHGYDHGYDRQDDSAGQPAQRRSAAFNSTPWRPAQQSQFGNGRPTGAATHSAPSGWSLPARQGPRRETESQRIK
jgi:hypothetical protein